MAEFIIHVRWGIFIGYLFPFFVFFFIIPLLSDEPDLGLHWKMALPFLYSLLLCLVLFIALKRKLAERRLMHFKGHAYEMVLSCLLIALWLMIPFFAYWNTGICFELLWANMGSLLFWIRTVFRDLRISLAEMRMSKHIAVEQQLTFRDRCSGYGLSKREVEVAELLCAGLTYREISDQLYISLHTVDNHVRHIFAKVEVNRKMDLFAKLRPDGNG